MDFNQKKAIVAEFEKQRNLKLTSNEIISDVQIIKNISTTQNIDNMEVLKIIESHYSGINRPDMKYNKPGK